eukprot:6177905-Pleurochrysis_carterae.AAC.1
MAYDVCAMDVAYCYAYKIERTRDQNAALHVNGIDSDFTMVKAESFDDGSADDQGECTIH